METLQQKNIYNPFLEYRNELESIISEKKYTTDITNMLRLSVPVMIEYYGHEYKDILFNVLKKVDIKIPKNDENMHDIVQKYTPPNIKKRSQICAVNDAELKRASGVHSLMPIFKIVNGTVVLVGRSEVVSVIKDDKKPLGTLASFVHELSHAFKSSQNSMNLLQDKDGNQIPNCCKELHNSLQLPASKNKYASPGYVQETLCADKLLTKCNMAQIVRQDQFIGTNNCEQRYNSITNNPQNTWQNLNSKIDISVKHTYDRYNYPIPAMLQKWFEEHYDEIIGNLQDIHSMLDECAKAHSEKYINDIKQ